MEKTKRKNYSYRQIVNSVRVMDDKDKERLIHALKVEKFQKTLDKLRESAKNVDVDLDEITEIMEKVRKERYEKKKQNHS